MNAYLKKLSCASCKQYPPVHAFFFGLAMIHHWGKRTGGCVSVSGEAIAYAEPVMDGCVAVGLVRTYFSSFRRRHSTSGPLYCSSFQLLFHYLYDPNIL